MTADSELSVLQAKVKRLASDRDIALRIADRTAALLRTTKAELDEAKAHLELIAVLQGERMPKQKRSWWRLW